jgi:cell division protein FtsB
LEEAYKEQYEKYTTEIEDLQKNIERDEKHFMRLVALYKKSCEPYKPYLHKECKSILYGMKLPAEQLEKNRSRLKEL